MRMARTLALLSFIALASAIPCEIGHAGESHNTAGQKARSESAPGDVPSAFFETLASVMTGTWRGKYTNGTFSEPSEWMPIRVEYRLTSAGSALVEDYIYDEEEPRIGMTTVYYKDNNELRLTHYCGASNHPSMIAQHIDAKTSSVRFGFTGITNLASNTDYHSREMEVTIVDSDNVHISYHGIMDGEVYSQAYDLTRYDTALRMSK